MIRLLPAPRLSRPALFYQKYTTNASSPELPEKLVYPDSPTANHNDLPSFLQYASQIDMDPASTVYVGTHYEYTVQTALSRLGMSLKRIGGRSDYGIDLLGTWNLPSAAQPLKVLIQCKAVAEKVKPSQARELEGAFVGAPTGWRGSGVLAFLVSKKPATKGVREALGRSRWPMGYVLCEDDGRVLQMLWNRKAEQESLEGVGVGLKYGGGEKSEREVVLTWKGEAIKD
ncbi:Uncharacterized protein LSUE1_G002431 [Lachnellula suecica]|uniref:Required for respiratory growth protein 7, mitochondrial n=1 Tax=Lachnellula suecica TaxID=602035 RepID=A0A8T9CEQ4_9HELO|nr:Uncharacterized protein LSUE1_G002431 [Lachnellula suecica]